MIDKLRDVDVYGLSVVATASVWMNFEGLCLVLAMLNDELANVRESSSSLRFVVWVRFYRLQRLLVAACISRSFCRVLILTCPFVHEISQ